MKFLFLTSLLASTTTAKFDIKPDLMGFLDGAVTDTGYSKNEASSRIIGGNVVTPGDFPFFVYLDLGGGFFCGGSLIHDDIVLTAAHCFDSSVISITAYVNTTNYGGSLQRKVTTILPHTGFAFKMTDPDIMLLKLESEVVGVPPLRLNSDPSVPVDMASVTTMGLGQTSFEGSFPDQLLEADINIVSIDDCNDDSSFKNFIQGDRQICANAQGKDICSGDSGSPLIYMDSTGTPIQVGLSSFGRGCGNFEFPGIHTRVSYFYHDWILPNLCNMAMNPPNECNALTTNNSNSTSDVTALNATNAAVTPSPTTKSPIHPPTMAPQTPETQQPSTHSPTSSSPTMKPPTSAPITNTAQATVTSRPTFLSTRKSPTRTQNMYSNHRPSSRN